MKEVLGRAAALVQAVRREHVPDLRLGVFEVALELEDGVLSLVGATSEPAAAEALNRRVALLDTRLQLRDEIVRLPDPALAERVHAVVTAAVAPVLAEPQIAETQVSQAVMGTRLRVLRRRGRWLQCRTPDGYLGWLHRGYLREVEEAEARAWEVGTEGEAAVSLGAEVVEEGVVVARLPWGARVVWQADGRVRLPNGRVGEVRGEVLPLAERAGRFPAEGGAVVQTARRWLGAPYLWGGLTPSGVDCSGFVQTVMRLHGVELPRDSDQQAQAGEEVEPERDFGNLLPGDLLFFAEDPGRITHVTMSVGGARIVHASLGNGGVWYNDLNGEMEYERELRRLFVCARRVV